MASVNESMSISACLRSRVCSRKLTMVSNCSLDVLLNSKTILDCSSTGIFVKSVSLEYFWLNSVNLEFTLFIFLYSPNVISCFISYSLSLNVNLSPSNQDTVHERQLKS